MSQGTEAVLLDLLRQWVPRQRWFPAKGTSSSLRHLGNAEITAAGPDRVLVVYLALDTAEGVSVLQVPVVLTAGSGEHRQAVVGTLPDGTEVLDGPHHPAFLAGWLAQATGPGIAELRTRTAGAQVLTGEQSNTSVLLPQGQAILKVFRVLAGGPHPEIEVTRALAEGGWTHVPAPLGWALGQWPDPQTGTGLVQGHLGVVSTFVPDADDGFDLACRHARTGADFTGPAFELGRTTAQMHAVLRTALPVHREDSASTRAANLAAAMRARADWALAQVPALAVHAEQIEHLITTVGAEELVPAAQRIHGDLHLGQALHSADGWHILDFEGEPLRPLAERTRPDQPLRDLAGLLRSIDYAAAIGEAGDPAWAAHARSALLAGYRTGEHDAGTGAEPAHAAQEAETLVRALEMDKALYEAVYEHHNRPQWLSIPLRAIRRLIEEHTMSSTDPGPAAPSPSAPSAPEASVPAQAGPATPSFSPAPRAVSAELLGAVAAGAYFAPHDVLGPHLDAEAAVVTFRTVRHLAERVEIVTAETRLEARHEQDGIWVAALAAQEVPDYRIAVTYDGVTTQVDDPYRFLPTLGEVDQHLIAEGRHERLWEALGAHLRTYPSVLGEVTGTSFSVWAPNARAVRVVGDFNSWDGTAHAMRTIGSTGVWELFIPDVGAGTTYKFDICYTDGSWHTKADPMARATEHPPATGSVVDASEYVWADAEWMTRRAGTDAHSGPMSIYEVHLGSWRPGLSYVDLAEQLVEYVQWLGFTHVELMPVAEHPFGGSWGYQVTSYYAPTSRFGSPDEFRYLVDTLHQAGIGVLVDWVPAHFPKDDWALARFDGTALYEDPDPMRGEQQDWGTYVFNFGRNEVRNFLVANAVYWLSEFHIDGLRVDAVASMLYLDYSKKAGQWRPNIRGGRENLEAIQLLQETNATAYRTNPGIVMIAEESTAWPGVTAATDAGGLGFGLKWNMGWMNDTLRYLAEEPINRRYHHGELTFSLVYAFSERFVLPLSHDEVVHGKGSLLRKMPGDRWQQLAGVRALLAYQWSHPGKNLLFMGQEFAQDAEWSEGASLDWAQSDSPGHSGVRECLRRLNRIYTENSALWAQDSRPEGFEWLEANDGDHNVLAYLRKDGEDVIAVLINFAGTPHEDYRLALPRGGAWDEIFNSDAAEYGGSGVGNLGQVRAEDVPWHGHRHSVILRVPPLGAVFLRPARG